MTSALRLACFSALLIAPVASPACNCHDGTVDPPGADWTHFDPHRSLPEVLAFAGPGSVLTSYDFAFVRSDGTMDLKTEAYTASASYEIATPAAADPSKPVGAGGFAGPGIQSVTVRIHRPGQLFTANTGGGQHDYVHRGMAKTSGTPQAGALPAIAAPACAPATLWQSAIAAGAPQQAVAIISWRDGAYLFTIKDTSISLRIGPDCKPLH